MCCGYISCVLVCDALNYIHNRATNRHPFFPFVVAELPLKQLRSAFMFHCPYSLTPPLWWIDWNPNPFSSAAAAAAPALDLLYLNVHKGRPHNNRTPFPTTLIDSCSMLDCAWGGGRRRSRSCGVGPVQNCSVLFVIIVWWLPKGKPIHRIVYHHPLPPSPLFITIQHRRIIIIITWPSQSPEKDLCCCWLPKNVLLWIVWVHQNCT